jgi:hypothetical protein
VLAAFVWHGLPSSPNPGESGFVLSNARVAAVPTPPKRPVRTSPIVNPPPCLERCSRHSSDATEMRCRPSHSVAFLLASCLAAFAQKLPAPGADPDDALLFAEIPMVETVSIQVETTRDTRPMSL